jgi:aspartate/methionine/tyrosine aminotransferase
MTLADRTMQSDYMNFAKLGTAAKYNLASSGVADCVLGDIGASVDDLALHGPSTYGYDPLMSAIAARFQVPEACVVMPGGGCSFANHLAMAAIVAPGDEVLIEDPTYELLTSALGYFQANVATFARRPADNWRLDVDAVAARLTPATRLVVLTNLHNPSSALTDVATVRAIATQAASVGALLLVDEVYLELMFRDGVARTAFTSEGNIVVTSSLTKAYGLSGLRCGWILAPTALAQKMRRLNDLFGVAPPHIAERLALVALGRLATLRIRANAMLDTNRAAYREILGGHPSLDQVVFDQGTTVFPRLRSGDGGALFQRLGERFETSLVPGRFFGRPEHIRVGLGGDTAMTRTGLERLSAALAEAR